MGSDVGGDPGLEREHDRLLGEWFGRAENEERIEDFVAAELVVLRGTDTSSSRVNTCFW